MFATLAALLLVFWFLGLLSSMTFGGLLHVLPLISAVLLLAELAQLWRSRKTGTSRGADA